MGAGAGAVSNATLSVGAGEALMMVLLAVGGRVSVVVEGLADAKGSSIMGGAADDEGTIKDGSSVVGPLLLLLLTVFDDGGVSLGGSLFVGSSSKGPNKSDSPAPLPVPEAASPINEAIKSWALVLLMMKYNRSYANL